MPNSGTHRKENSHGLFRQLHAPTLFARIYRFFLPSTPVDRLNVLLKKHYMYKDLGENGIQFYNE